MYRLRTASLSVALSLAFTRTSGFVLTVGWGVAPPSVGGGTTQTVSLVAQELAAIERSVDNDYEEDSTPRRIKNSRWESLNPKTKARIIKAGQDRAIANKQKRESAQSKKRRK